MTLLRDDIYDFHKIFIAEKTSNVHIKIKSFTCSPFPQYWLCLVLERSICPEPVVWSSGGSPGWVWSPWVGLRSPGGPSSSGGCPASAWWWCPPSRARSSSPAGGRRWGRGCASWWSLTAGRRWCPGNLQRQINWNKLLTFKRPKEDYEKVVVSTFEKKRLELIVFKTPAK